MMLKNVKKNLIRIIVMLTFLVAKFNSFAYADVVWIDENGVKHGGSTIKPETDKVLGVYSIIKGIIIIVICIIAFMVLKKVAKNRKERKNKDDMEN